MNPKVRMKQSLIFPFKTKHAFYIYDASSNYIFKVSELQFDILSHHLLDKEAALHVLSDKYNATEIEKCLKRLLELREVGLLGSQHPIAMATHQSPEDIRKTYQCSQLILNVTENCNFRCRYCSLNNEVFFGAPGYSTRVMSVEVASRAIDFFHAYAKMDQSEGLPLGLSFYGGEPLLAVERINQVLAYARQIFGSHYSQLHLSLTTNGSQFSDEVIDFLIQNDFSVLVSLDGYQEAHDRYRRTVSGKPTFHKVIAGLERIYSKAPDYYRRRVGINCVIGYHTNLHRLREEFGTNKLISDAITKRVAYINTRLSTLSEDPSHREWHLKEWTQLFDDFCKQITEVGRPELLESVMFDQDFLRIHKRNLGGCLCKIPLNACCIPGTRRLFVDVDGNFHTCERIIPTMPLGNVWDGLNFDLVWRLEKQYAELSWPECSACFAVRLCSLCWAQCVDEKGRLNMTLKQQVCQSIKWHIARALQHYCSVLEENPHAFDYLDNYVIL